MDVNVLSMFLTCRAVVPRMRERGGGRIVNISSGTPFRGVPFLLHYVTSKGAIVTLTKALAKELGPDEVLVNCVAPGFTMSAGVREHPEVVDALRDVSLVRADAQARPGARGRRRRRRVPLRPGVDVRHRPDHGHRRRPVLPLRLALFAHRAAPRPPGATRPLRPRRRRGARRAGRGRGRRAALDARPARATRPARCCRTRSTSTRPRRGSCAATASTSSPAASPTATRTPGRASAACSSARSRSTARAASTRYGPGGGVVRARPRPGAGHDARRRAVGLRPGAAAARRASRGSGRSATSTPPTPTSPRPSARRSSSSTSRPGAAR